MEAEPGAWLRAPGSGNEALESFLGNFHFRSLQEPGAMLRAPDSKFRDLEIENENFYTFCQKFNIFFAYVIHKISRLRAPGGSGLRAPGHFLVAS